MRSDDEVSEGRETKRRGKKVEQSRAKKTRYRNGSTPPHPPSPRHSARAERKEWRKGWLSRESGAFLLRSAWLGGWDMSIVIL